MAHLNYGIIYRVTLTCESKDETRVVDFSASRVSELAARRLARQQNPGFDVFSLEEIQTGLGT